MAALSFVLQAQANLETLTQEAVKTSEIEGRVLDAEQVRSSLARRLGLPEAGLAPAQRDVDGLVEVLLDASKKAHEPLSAERLKGWHAALFPTARSGLRKIIAGDWRDDANGPMQVVSGPAGARSNHIRRRRPGSPGPGGYED